MSKLVSVDNGQHYVTADDLSAEWLVGSRWETLTHYMSDAEREAVHGTTDDAREFLRSYLEVAPCDLVVG